MSIIYYIDNLEMLYLSSFYSISSLSCQQMLLNFFLAAVVCYTCYRYI